MSFAYVAVVSKGTATRSVFSSAGGSGAATLLTELRRLCARALDAEPSRDARAEARALQRGLKGELRPLLERFSAPGGGDKVRAMQDKARAVQSAITSTLNKATERDGLLEELQYKSVKLEKSAAGFSSGAATLRRGACCKLYGIYFFLLLVLALVVGIALLVTKYQYHMW